MRNGAIGGAGATALALALAVNLAGCGAPAGAVPEMPPPQVGVVRITPQQHAFEVQLTGRINAYQISDVRPQVGGIVRSRRFEEGAKVRAGQVLYEIDAGPAQAQFAGAE